MVTKGVALKAQHRRNKRDWARGSTEAQVDKGFAFNTNKTSYAIKKMCDQIWMFLCNEIRTAF